MLPAGQTLFRTLILLSSIASLISAFTLITFDVDGTLLRGVGESRGTPDAHSRAFSHACASILNSGTPIPPLMEALPPQDVHGSTDGLILLRLARSALGISPDVSAPRLDDMMDCMHDYVSALTDEEVAKGIEPLPGVIPVLRQLAERTDEASCGLVTGNVEGVARKKMKAMGIWDTGALSSPSTEQLQKRKWAGTESIGFLGGFGSDFCSGDIDEPSRNYLDRAEQIAIAARRCQSMIDGKTLKRVVHVGDAPADVLAAQACAKMGMCGEGIEVSIIGVATGKFSAAELKELAGEPEPGLWEPIILEEGIADPGFLQACGL